MSKLSLPIVPAGLFGIVLGITGMASAWRSATQVWGVAPWVGETLSLAGAAIWVVLIGLYVLKLSLRRAEAAAEFRHPVLCCFVGIVPLTTALVGASTRAYLGAVSTALVTIGIAGTVLFGVYRTGVLWRGNRDPATTTPVLYLPTVAGNFGSAIALGAMGHGEWGVPFFGVGLLSWLAIESVLINRLYNVAELAVPLRPSMGIQLAPAAVGCAAYLSVTSGRPDMVVEILIGYSVFQTLIVLRLLPWIRQQPFAASYWAFSFGLSALATSVTRFVERGGDGPVAAAAPYVFVFVNLVMVTLIVGTIRLLGSGKMLPPPLAAPAAPPAAPPRVSSP